MNTTNRLQSSTYLSAFMCLFLTSLLLQPSLTHAQQKKKKKKSVPLPASIELLKDIEFAAPKGISLKLDLYRPKKQDAKLPAIVFVHGGGWKNGSKAAARKNAAWIAEHGFIVAAISYRLTDKGQWPDQIDDCYTAVRWLRSNRKKYNVDADNIGCWGSSAGGHLVALMGTRHYPGKEDVSSRVQAVCDWFGPSELLTMPYNMVANGRTREQVANSNGAKLLGAAVMDVPEKAKDASALDNVSKDDPPFLIMHGSEDPGVPLIQSEKLHKKLKAAGVDSTLHVLEGAKHGGKAFQTPEARKVVLAFFTRVLKK